MCATFSSDIAFQMDSVHLPIVRHIDFNPNVQYTLATCGDDCRIALWDTRKIREPLITRTDHTHWYGMWDNAGDTVVGEGGGNRGDRVGCIMIEVELR